MHSYIAHEANDMVATTWSETASWLFDVSCPFVSVITLPLLASRLATY